MTHLSSTHLVVVCSHCAHIASTKCRPRARKSSTAPHPSNFGSLTGTSPSHSPDSSATAAAIHSNGGLGAAGAGRPPTRPSSQQPHVPATDGWRAHEVRAPVCVCVWVNVAMVCYTAQFASRHVVNNSRTRNDCVLALSMSTPTS
eukprot:scaffold11752_cov20-Tisochrysis_lutea.AAC.5